MYMSKVDLGADRVYIQFVNFVLANTQSYGMFVESGAGPVV